MKKILYINVLRLTIAATVLSGLTLSCSDDVMDKINEDINHPTSLSSNFVITQVQTSLAFNVVGGDYNSYIAVCIEHEGGADSQMYETDMRYYVMEDPSSWGNTWAYTYNNLAACKDIISICSEDGAEPDNAVNLGIGKTLMAYQLALATDLHGDIPWSEALDFSVYRAPQLDKQETIYQEVFRLLDEALTAFNGGKASIAAQDLYYGGNVSNWIKAVYGLKARYTMRLLGRSSDRNGDLNKVLDYVSKSFTSASEEMKLDKYDAATFYNPLYTFARSRDYLGFSKSLMDKFVARNDPRQDQVAVNSNYELISPSSSDYNPIHNGEQDKGVYTKSAPDWAEKAPTQLLSYHELLFLKAEAQARLGQDPSETLRAAIAAGFENLANTIQAAINSTFKNKVSGELTLSAAAGEEHFDKNVKPLLSANAVKQVMIEKYLAFFGASGEGVEAYADIRRLKYLNEDYIELVNPNNAASATYPKGHFPLRLGYGNGDTNNNPNVSAAQGDGSFIYSEPVWWAGGSR